MAALFELKQILLNNKLQMFVLGSIIPMIFVFVVFQMRYTLKLKTFRVALFLAFSTIALVPSMTAYFQYNPSLSLGDCIRHKGRFITIRDKDGEFTTSLSYMVRSVNEGRYELINNNAEILRIRVNKVDLDAGFERISKCPGRILEADKGS